MKPKNRKKMFRDTFENQGWVATQNSYGATHATARQHLKFERECAFGCVLSS